MINEPEFEADLEEAKARGCLGPVVWLDLSPKEASDILGILCAYLIGPANPVEAAIRAQVRQNLRRIGWQLRGRVHCPRSRDLLNKAFGFRSDVHGV